MNPESPPTACLKRNRMEDGDGGDGLSHGGHDNDEVQGHGGQQTSSYIIGASRSIVTGSNVVGSATNTTMTVINNQCVHTAPGSTLKQKIKGRTETLFKEWTKDMITTEASKTLIHKLNKGASWITVIGNPGEGKSTTAFLALQYMHGRGREVFEIRTPEEYEAVKEAPKVVIMIDDMFGQFQYNQSLFKWETVVTDILKLAEHKAQSLTEKTDDTNLSFIMTSRTDVLKSATIHFGKFSNMIVNAESTLDLSQVTCSQATENMFLEREKIWESHARKKEISIEKNIVRQVCRMNLPHGFPHCCKLYANTYYPKVSMKEFFFNPIPFLNDSMKSFMREKKVGYIFRQMLKNDGSFDLESIENEDECFDLSSHCEPLEGTYISREGSVITFQHPSIYDSAAFILSELFPKFVIENCSLRFLNERVRFEQLQHEEKNETCMIKTFKPESVNPFMQRLKREVTSCNIQYALSHPSFQDHSFASDFLKTMSSSQTISSLITSKDKNTGQSFLFYSSSSKSDNILRQICTSMELTTAQQEDCILGICEHSSVASMHFFMNIYKGANFDCQNINSKTPLIIAASKSCDELLRLLLTLNVNDTLTDDIGWSALHYVCRHGVKGDGDVVDLLIGKLTEADLSMFTSCNTKRNPFLIACDNGHMKVVAKLVNKDACVNTVNGNLNTGFQRACLSGHVDVTTLLLDKGADINTVSAKGHTALHYACGAGHHDVVTLLLDKGADINVEDGNGRTALLYACVNGHHDVVTLLLDKGADINVVDGNGPNALYAACVGGHHDVVTLLLDKGADINVVDGDGLTALHAACSSGFLDVVTLLLDKVADINVVDGNGLTALRAACGTGHHDVMTLLLDKGVDINVVDGNGLTALRAACGTGHHDLVTLLLDKGADINVVDGNGLTALHYACVTGDYDFVTFLLDKGADINVVDGNGHTALHYACGRGHHDVVNLLLDKGADINVEDGNGHTALHYACGRGHHDVVTLLLDKGADINVVDGNGHTALHAACIRGHHDVVTLLLDKVADINVVDGNGRTALHAASVTGHHDVVTLLLDKGADINVVDGNGRTALRYASVTGHHDVVTLLLDKGAGINVVDGNGHTALHAACSRGHHDVVTLLLDKGADINVVDGDGLTALHAACGTGRLDVVTLLLDKGADINVLDGDGLTALHAACVSGLLDVVTLLLDKGADINVVDGNGRTALHYACIRGHHDVVTLLLDKGADINVVMATLLSIMHVVRYTKML